MLIGKLNQWWWIHEASLVVLIVQINLHISCVYRGPHTHIFLCLQGSPHSYIFVSTGVPTLIYFCLQGSPHSSYILCLQGCPHIFMFTGVITLTIYFCVYRSAHTHHIFCVYRGSHTYFYVYRGHYTHHIFCVYRGPHTHHIFKLLASFKRGQVDNIKVRMGRLQVRIPTMTGFVWILR